MMESQIVIRVEREILNQFKALCLLQHTTPTLALTRYISECVQEHPLPLFGETHTVAKGIGND